MCRFENEIPLSKSVYSNRKIANALIGFQNVFNFDKKNWINRIEMNPEFVLEFLGSFMIWMLHGFKGSLSDHYSKGSGSKQVLRFFIGIMTIVVIGTILALLFK